MPATPGEGGPAVEPVEAVPEPIPDAPVAPAEDALVTDGQPDEADPVAAPVDIAAPVRAAPSAGEVGEVAAPAPVTLPLRATGGEPILRLFGEYDSAEFLIDLSDPVAVTALDIVMQSSVNILPETSLITVTVNGMPAVETQPFAFDGFEALAVPTEALVAGTNRIGVTVRQVHRIFCGPEATFQIWTEIDATASGATVASGAVTGDPSAFAAALGARPSITVVSAEAPDPALLAEIGRRLARPDGRPAPTIVVVTPWDPVTTAVAVPRIAIRADATVPAMLRTGADGAAVLVLAPDVPVAALDPFLPLPPAQADNPAVTPGIAATLGDLGMEDIEIRRRYGRVDVAFTLPEDWMLRASQGARIDLLYRYAEGLARDALMLVKVNGTTVRLLPLFGEPDVDLPLLPVGFSTRLLEPGTNIVSFETIVPGDPPDLPCSPIDGPLVEILAESVIVVPPSPRMAFPSAATLLRNLDSAGITIAEGAVPGALADRVATGLEVVLAPLEGGPEGGAAELTVAGLSEIDRLPLTALGLTRRTLEDLLAAPFAEVPVAEMAEVAVGPVAMVQGWVEERWAAIVRLGWPGDPPLADWLQGRQGVALLLIPDPAERLSGWLVAAPAVDPDWLARMVADARLDPDGPKGEAAVLTSDGRWENWRPAATPPALLETPTLANMRTVAGNYAAWAPLLYVALLGGLVVVSVIIGLVFVVRTRGRRKR
jgi:hypothetical protein